MTRRPATDDQISVALRFVVIGAVLLVIGFLIGLAVHLVGGTTEVDVWWNAFVPGFAPGARDLALLLDVVGAGVIATYVVPLGVAALLVLARRPWGALLFVLASAVSAGVVQLLKGMFGRVRPEEILVISDHGSFPSGHTANAATIAVLFVVLFPRVWVAVAGIAWTILMAFGRTQVHAHWLSDTIGATFLGAGVALLVSGAFAIPVLRELERKAERARQKEQRSLG